MDDRRNHARNPNEGVADHWDQCRETADGAPERGRVVADETEPNPDRDPLKTAGQGVESATNPATSLVKRSGY